MERAMIATIATLLWPRKRSQPFSFILWLQTEKKKKRLRPKRRQWLVEEGIGRGGRGEKLKGAGGGRVRIDIDRGRLSVLCRCSVLTSSLATLRAPARPNLTRSLSCVGVIRLPFDVIDVVAHRPLPRSRRTYKRSPVERYFHSHPLSGSARVSDSRLCLSPILRWYVRLFFASPLYLVSQFLSYHLITTQIALSSVWALQFNCIWSVFLIAPGYRWNTLMMVRSIGTQIMLGQYRK